MNKYILACVLLTVLANVSACEEQDSAEEKYNIGASYWFGNDKPVDKKLACDYFEISANKGYMLGEYNLGNCFRLGEGREKNLEKSIFWLEKASESGSASAQASLAMIYLFEKKNENEEKIYNILLDSSRKNNMYAEFLLGYLYHDGIYVDRSDEKSIELYVRSASKGHLLSQVALIYIYENGVYDQNIDNEKSSYWKKVFEFTRSSRSSDITYDSDVGYLKEKGII